MDDFSMEGELLVRTLKRLAWINKWLGGNRVTFGGLKILLKNVPKTQKIRLVDLGCGGGDMLRLVADFFRKEGRPSELIGIDANAFTIRYAREQSKEYPEIHYLHETIPSRAFSDLKYDVLVATLFLHHFPETDALQLLSEITGKARIGVLINDLHRSRRAYILFSMLTIFIANPMIRQDGLTSILRGFKKEELQAFAKKLQLKNSIIRWRWAFRYQWTIKC